MSPITIVEITATLLWCYAGVLLVSWVRAVARLDRRDHVAQFVSLMGEFVPMSCGAVILIFMGSFLGLPSVVVLLAIVIPAGLALGLQIEVVRLSGTQYSREARRLAVALLLAGAFVMSDLVL